MTTKLAVALAETFSQAELEQLREELIAEWVEPGTEGRLWIEAPAAGGRLIHAVADAECQARP